MVHPVLDELAFDELLGPGVLFVLDALRSLLWAVKSFFQVALRANTGAESSACPDLRRSLRAFLHSCFLRRRFSRPLCRWPPEFGGETARGSTRPQFSLKNSYRKLSKSVASREVERIHAAVNFLGSTSDRTASSSAHLFLSFGAGKFNLSFFDRSKSSFKFGTRAPWR